ncbi:hypothetical protein [Commensalibacter papalotli (ex Servin-Garciduenas et al. 2014)]|uniref:DUF2867 domain-containing protein n=1 Tax=Commensalibacter papalotli (ex Servin-Garciduenas et al. 2014) TaxID=1208583 RepID=W7E5Z2_9PROT|nr:hypothetical protein [Commensalibacter papalotli (ex Servin-Garciduenas et al. 2014)]EUK18511.1 hypothetical protein COMX_02145 [Commensalibacter papalotli (ex Servin-Garciduenas et al. 2014)]
MLIDKYLHSYHFSEQHSIIVNSTPIKVLSAAVHYDTQSDYLFKIAIILRELPNRILKKDNTQTIKSFSMKQFTCLEKVNEQEIVFGLLGRFWEINYGLSPCQHTQDFISFNQPKSAKLVLNFHVTPLKHGKTLLSTETRVFCIDKYSLRSFSYYWYLIRPVSGVIRHRMLKAIAKNCQNL